MEQILKVLVVDGEVQFAELGAKFFRAKGHLVFVANRSADALITAGREKPQLIITKDNLGGESIFNGAELSDLLMTIKPPPVKIFLVADRKPKTQARHVAKVFRKLTTGIVDEMIASTVASMNVGR